MYCLVGWMTIWISLLSELEERDEKLYCRHFDFQPSLERQSSKLNILSLSLHLFLLWGHCHKKMCTQKILFNSIMQEDQKRMEKIQQQATAPSSFAKYQWRKICNLLKNWNFATLPPSKSKGSWNKPIRRCGARLVAGKVEIGPRKRIMKSQMMNYEIFSNWKQTHNSLERIKSAHVSAVV